MPYYIFALTISNLCFMVYPFKFSKTVLLERIRAEKKAKFGKKFADSYVYKGDDNYRFFNFFPGYASRAFRVIFGICMTASE